MYPLTISSVIMGFGFRNLEISDYRIVSLTPLYFYTSHKTLGYLSDHWVTYGTPFCFSEGLFDAEYISLLYPLSFAYLTSSINDYVAQFFSMLTIESLSYQIMIPQEKRWP